MIKRYMALFLIIVLGLSTTVLSAQTITYTINPGTSAVIHCDTELSIVPQSGKDITVECATAVVPTNTATNTSTATATNTNTTIPNTPTSTSTNTATATNTPTNTPVIPTATATATQVTSGDCARLYSNDSPWNTLIGNSPVYDENSNTYITAFGGTFGSDPTQYTYPVWLVDSSTPIRTVNGSGLFSNVTSPNTLVKTSGGFTVQIPIPDGAVQSAGGDANIVMLNKATGDEWGFVSASKNSDGSWNVKNGYHYNTAWNAVPPSGFGSRGAGLPYLAGLIFPCEIQQGHIDHALAFAYDYPTPQFIYPATKSDGIGSYPPDMPEGTRLQLNPALTDSEIQAWGCTGSCLIVAHALQDYGMIVIDRSGHPKLYAEYEATAHWNGLVKASTPSTIPYNNFKVLNIP